MYVIILVSIYGIIYINLYFPYPAFSSVAQRFQDAVPQHYDFRADLSDDRKVLKRVVVP